MEDFSSLKEEPEFTVFPTKSRDLVVVKDLEVRSMCAHHLAPFFGKCTIAYYPNGVLAGLSKFQRTLDHICMVPTEQETLTEAIYNYLNFNLHTDNIVVIMEAQHTCMIVRGVQVSGSITQTITARGKFEDNYQLINLILNK